MEFKLDRHLGTGFASHGGSKERETLLMGIYLSDLIKAKGLTDAEILRLMLTIMMGVCMHACSWYPQVCCEGWTCKRVFQIHCCLEMRFKMSFKTEDSSQISWFMGTRFSVQIADLVHWPDSPRRHLLGYTVVMSYKRASLTFNLREVSLAFKTIDSLGETFMVVRGTNRKTVGAEALRMGVCGPWITKSYLELILNHKGISPLLASTSTTNQEGTIPSTQHIRVTPNKLEYLSQTWTRSPTKSKMEPILATWHFISTVPSGADASVFDPSSFRDNLQLAQMPESYDFDRGLLLAVQAIQALLESKGLPVIVGIGDPSGSGKTSLAHKMANIIGCEVVSLENYYKSEHVKDYKYDDFSSLDISLLSKIGLLSAHFETQDYGGKTNSCFKGFDQQITRLVESFVTSWICNYSMTTLMMVKTLRIQISNLPSFIKCWCRRRDAMQPLHW